MKSNRAIWRAIAGLSVGIGLAATASADTLPIIDTHLHYNEPAWAMMKPAEVVDLLEKSVVPQALVSSTPDDGSVLLYEQDSSRVVPFVRPYHGSIGASDWATNQAVPTYLAGRLARSIYRSIGEIHLYDPADADSAVVGETINLAMTQDLFLLVHSGAEAIERLFAKQPGLRILWAHAGMSEAPERVSQLLDAHTALWTEISIREFEVAPGGQLDEAWRQVFLRHPDRFMIGSDTYVNAQWQQYGEILAFDRKWLDQLPRAVAEAIAFRNAARVFDLEVPPIGN